MSSNLCQHEKANRPDCTDQRKSSVHGDNQGDDQHDSALDLGDDALDDRRALHHQSDTDDNHGQGGDLGGNAGEIDFGKQFVQACSVRTRGCNQSTSCGSISHSNN